MLIWRVATLCNTDKENIWFLFIRKRRPQSVARARFVYYFGHYLIFREVSQKKLNYIMSLNKSEDALDAELSESMDEEVGEANIKRRTVVGPWKNL